MSIKVGDVIVEIETQRRLTVDGLWNHASDVIDFSAKYHNRAGIDRYGNPVFANRGFKFNEEDVVWAKLN